MSKQRRTLQRAAFRLSKTAEEKRKEAVIVW